MLILPDIFLKIKRPDKIIVKYEDADKKKHKMKLEGLASRVFHHEYDHMEGIDFTQRLIGNNEYQKNRFYQYY